MAMKNKYAYRSRISEAKIRQLVKLFSVDLTASQIAELSGVNRNTVNRYVTAFRERIARYCEAESPVKGEVEVDESYFGARRVRGIRGRGARGKTIVFGLFKRNDNVKRNGGKLAHDGLLTLGIAEKQKGGMTLPSRKSCRVLADTGRHAAKICQQATWLCCFSICKAAPWGQRQAADYRLLRLGSSGGHRMPPLSTKKAGISD